MIAIAPAMSTATDPVDQNPVAADEPVTEGAQPEMQRDADVVVERVPSTPPATENLERVVTPPLRMMEVDVPQTAQTPRRSKRALEEEFSPCEPWRQPLEAQGRRSFTQR